MLKQCAISCRLLLHQCLYINACTSRAGRAVTNIGGLGLFLRSLKAIDNRYPDA
ncbi:hypothetical protein K8B83_19150 [Shewanella inventionis]|uniref:hypothetical protein n=1 Tax=Shewanella inventionis TaxID=1738770 RepID=UPI00166EC3C6|nr:hypothetical protein [Shewanella inventionis]UAL42908.1 hypothetical protein K8B83_19150 [Shewanella inventionis]